VPARIGAAAAAWDDPPVRRGGLALGAAGLGIAAGLFTLWIVSRGPDASFSGSTTPGRVALLAAGWGLLAAGLGSWLLGPPGPSGPLLAAAGVGWLVLGWNNPAAGSAAAFTAGLVLYASCPALVGHAALAYPRGRLASRVERAAVALAYVASLLVLGLLPALFLDPVRQWGCNDCPRNLLLVSARPPAVDALNRVGAWLGAATAVGLALLVGARLVSGRRAWTPVLAAAAAYLALAGALYGAWIHLGVLWNGPRERRLWLAEAAALVALALAVGWSLARAARRRAAVARIAVELAQSPPAGGLRDALAAILGDPDVRLAFPLGRSGRLVDSRGDSVALDPAQEHTTLTADGQPLALLSHAPHLLDDERLVGEVAAAARLALRHERLQAEARARLDELRRSRARIVDAGDAERRRLERDLHDGAQQRLVGLALSLRLLRSRLDAGAAPAVRGQLARAEADLRAAIEALRELAHGIFPAELADGGLGPALGALAEDARVPIRLDGVSADRFPTAVESAAYLVVAETATAADGGLVVHAERAGATLLLEVDARALYGRLDRAELEDRVAAADGRLSVEQRDGGVRIRAEFPCAS
jgi:signal transduction histidine kinase